eukprot:258648-Alexandrium_andersonii.AAC.1
MEVQAFAHEVDTENGITMGDMDTMDVRAFAGEEPSGPVWSEPSDDSKAGGAGRQFRDDITG